MCRIDKRDNNHTWFWCYSLKINYATIQTLISKTLLHISPDIFFNFFNLSFAFAKMVNYVHMIKIKTIYIVSVIYFKPCTPFALIFPTFHAHLCCHLHQMYCLHTLALWSKSHIKLIGQTLSQFTSWIWNQCNWCRPISCQPTGSRGFSCLKRGPGIKAWYFMKRASIFKYNMKTTGTYRASRRVASQ